MKTEHIGQYEVHPVASIFPLLTGEEFEQLVTDIRENGQHEPVLRMWVKDEISPKTRKPLILDGRNRLRACDRAGVKPEFIDYAGPTDTESLLKLVRSKNLARRHLDESARALVAARARDLYDAAAKERQADAARATNAKRTGAPAPDAQRSSALSGKASELAAADFNVSPRLVELAKSVDEKGSAEVKRAVERGQLKVSAAAELVKHDKATQKEILEKSKGKSGTASALAKQYQRAKLGEQLRQKPLPPPKGPWDVIVGDPPWKYDLRDEDPTHRGITPYPPMSVDEICLLPIEDLAAENAVLWLWTSNPHLLDGSARSVALAWGFTPKALLTWDKVNPAPGHYLFGRTEHCLICTRGSPVITLGNQTNIITEKKREHSRKPEAFYELVKAITPGSTLELFSRTPRDGWAAWGAEVEKFARPA